VFSLNGTKVKLFRLSQAYHITGVGQVGPGAITTQGMANLTGKLDLTYVDGGVLLEGTLQGKKVRSVIPVGNIVGVDLESETNEKNSKPVPGTK
jgi:hypothetical protein